MDASSERKGYKRQRLADDIVVLPPHSDPPTTPDKETQPTPNTVQQADLHVQLLKSLSKKTLSSEERVRLRRAAHSLSEFAKKEDRNDILVEAGAIPVLVNLLTLFAPRETGPLTQATISEDIEKEVCYIISILANKNEYQLRMAEAGALCGLVNILKRYALTVRTSRISAMGVSLIRRAADAVTNMAHENVTIKTRVRLEDGISPLVTLLEAIDIKIQKAAASALRTLAFKNEQNKDQIVQCGALPTLVHMLHAEDTGIHYEAVGVIGNLVHSSSHIKRNVLEIGALQPIIGLLSSKCQDAQREAALLIGQFATVDPSYKPKIVQRGAVPPLVTMLAAEDRQLREMAAFAIGRVAQNEDNQAGIVQAGGLTPLLDLISSDDGNLQHNAAFALYGLADNPDNISAFIREGSVQILLGCQLNSQVQASRDCIQKTLKRLEEKVQGHVLDQTLYLLHSPDVKVQQRCAIALAMLLKNNLKKAFVDRRGLEIIGRMIKDGAPCSSLQKEAAVALHELAVRAKAVVPLEGPPAPASGSAFPGLDRLEAGEDWDVIFLVEGEQLAAHRSCLQQASEAFRAMFAGNYLEKNALYIPIPNIRYQVFDAMIRCIYSGVNEVVSELIEELLSAADQYMLEGLKRYCEEQLAQRITLENVFQHYAFSRDAHAPHLAAHCVMFCLSHYDDLCSIQAERADVQAVLQNMIPLLTDTIKEQLSRAAER